MPKVDRGVSGKCRGWDLATQTALSPSSSCQLNSYAGNAREVFGLLDELGLAGKGD